MSALAVAPAPASAAPAAVELVRLRHLLAEKEREIARLRDRAPSRRKAGRERGGHASAALDETLARLREAYLDPADQLRFEIELEWAARIPAAEKSERPLRRFALGPEFVASLETLEGVARTKVVSVIVEVLTGLALELGGREVHQLRTGRSGGSPGVVRGDGALCWRVALQRGTASARRLHYWQRVDGVIELSRVVKHDDMRP